jgi:hypothetical protein
MPQSIYDLVRIDTTSCTNLVYERVTVDQPPREEGCVWDFRRDRIPVDGASVLLFPLSATQVWMPIAEAVEIVKQEANLIGWSQRLGSSFFQ